MVSPFIQALLVPHTEDDRLDRRGALEADTRNASNRAFIEDWLRKHHPRFGGKAAQ